jgi:Flp pilus assembly protein TadB
MCICVYVYMCICVYVYVCVLVHVYGYMYMNFAFAFLHFRVFRVQTFNARQLRQDSRFNNTCDIDITFNATLILDRRV